MAVSTTQQISRYYDFFRDKEIIFTKANIKALHLDPRQVYLKCNGGQWPCLINSSSFQMAKVIVGTGGGAYNMMTKNKDATISIRYCFLDQNNSPVQFFVNSIVDEIKPYQNSQELALVTLNFTQRPPDELIWRIGEFAEASENFINRKEERIVINKDTLRKLGMEKDESMVNIDNVPRRCIIKDLSFGGTKIMLVGIPKFLINKPVFISLDFADLQQPIMLSGRIQNADFLEGRKDISVVNVSYDVENIPMTYKIRINNFITTYQKAMLGSNSNKSMPSFNPLGNQTAKPAEGPKIGENLILKNNVDTANAKMNNNNS